MDVYVNGEKVARAQEAALLSRGGQLGLWIQMDPAPVDGDVEVRFTNFKLYTWSP
jgi:hypothetical protein